MKPNCWWVICTVKSPEQKECWNAYRSFFIRNKTIYKYPRRSELQVCKTDEESGKDGQLHLVVVHAMKMFIPCTNIFHFERSRLWHKVSGVEIRGTHLGFSSSTRNQVCLALFPEFLPWGRDISTMVLLFKTKDTGKAWTISLKFVSIWTKPL